METKQLTIEKAQLTKAVSDSVANVARLFDRCPTELNQLVEFILDNSKFDSLYEDDGTYVLKAVNSMYPILIGSELYRKAIDSMLSEFSKLPQIPDRPDDLPDLRLFAAGGWIIFLTAVVIIYTMVKCGTEAAEHLPDSEGGDSEGGDAEGGGSEDG
jgi:hypothetical protein